MKAVTIAVLAAPIVVPPAAWPQPLQDQSVETVTIRLSNFAFNPEQLRLRVGVPVRLHLENAASGEHNFSSPALLPPAYCKTVRRRGTGKSRSPAAAAVWISY